MKHEKLRILIPTIAEVPNYLNALTALGAAPEALDRPVGPDSYDGLLLPGGGDIDPQRYGQEVNGSRWVKPELDALQFAVLDAFVKAKKPVFGICRGHQLLNVYFGGSLLQDIESPIQHSPVTRGVDSAHPIRAEKGSWLFALHGGHFTTNSAHHQGGDRLGDGLTAIAFAEDGVVEASQHSSLPIWSVQYHPERMCFSHRREDTVDGSAELAFFLDRCREHRDQ